MNVASKNEDGQVRIPANVIIIGFTGSISSGCSEFATWLKDKKDYEYYSLSKPIHEIAQKKEKSGEIDQITQEILQDIGNDLRREHGPKILAHIALKELDKRYATKPFEKIVIDSLRNIGEVKLLREYPRFYLLSIHADQEQRRHRWQENYQDKTYSDFSVIDKRDAEENLWYGQQVKQCCDESDIAINNQNVDPIKYDFKKSKSKSNYFDSKLYKYLKLIEQGPQIDYRPQTHEKLMTIAYLESLSSSCSQRKVGAVIATIQGDILSTGFNHVPEGEEPCIVAYDECYRKHLRKDNAKEIIFCPKCGEKIVQKCPNPKCKEEFEGYSAVCSECGQDMKFDYECSNPNCKSQVFELFTIGGKKSIGKGLDVCRALHAEENAIVNLARSGKTGSENSVLYSTTFPCTLCANKIVQSKIKKVVFGEPYTMEDAEKLLRKQNIKIERFEGVKSTAFFRLYGSTLEVVK